MRMALYLLAMLGIFLLLSQFGLQKYLDKPDTQEALAAHTFEHPDQQFLLIRTALATLQKNDPSFSRIRVAIIHAGILPDGSIIWQSDNIATIDDEDHIAENLARNIPLNQWTDYLGSLLDDKCVFMQPQNMRNETARARVIANGVAAFMVCPIMNNKQHRLLGALFANWHELNAVPADHSYVQRTMQHTASSIVSMLKPSTQE